MFSFAKKFILILIVFMNIFRNNHAADTCADVLNVQSGSDRTASSDGIVTCATGYTKCGKTLATGAGVCLLTAVSTSSSTTFYSGAVDSAGGAITAQSNFITTCWNPSTGAAVSATSPAVILACYTSRNGVGSVISVTVGATTTATTNVPSLSSSGAYCFSTNCNTALYVSSGPQTKINIFLVFLGAISAGL